MFNLLNFSNQGRRESAGFFFAQPEVGCINTQALAANNGTRFASHSPYTLSSILRPPVSIKAHREACEN
jgi:hypothetical protein